jgi:hypothetical protein
MRHHSAIKWEEQLDKAMRELDHFLEEKFKGQYVLHPARPRQGKTTNPSQDGLFSIAANFSLGLGSEIGKGYVVDIKLVTLQSIPKETREEIENMAMEKLDELLPKYFPDVDLDISKDGPVLKIHGDLSLGNV